LANFKDASGISFGRGYNTVIGFDVTIIDQDEGTTTTPQRMVWSNDGKGNNGSIDESWNNMDGAGEISLQYVHTDYWAFPLELLTYYIELESKSGSLDSLYVNTHYYNTWTASTNETWLSIEPSLFTGSGFVKVMASENEGVRRTAKVFINWGKYESTYFMVTQLANGEVGISATKIEQLHFYPNPTKDKFTIQGSIDNVQLFNSLGVLVKETAVVGKTVSVSELPNGVYIVKAYKNGQFKGVTKIIKD